MRNEIKTAGYGIFNLRSSYEWQQIRVDLGIENLFDRYYTPPLGGAYTDQGITMGSNSTPYGIAGSGCGTLVLCED